MDKERIDNDLTKVWLVCDESFTEKKARCKKIEKNTSKQNNFEKTKLQKLKYRKLYLAQKDEIRVRMKTKNEDKGESERVRMKVRAKKQEGEGEFKGCYPF
jgi:hypothetical protein